MRVIAGEARGVPLKAPRGSGTRPTSDKVKGVIFSMLASMGAEPEQVLDLYAGSGALGIEALSRGAGHADLVESSAAACAVIRDNLEKTKLASRARVIRTDVERALARLEGPYDLVFFDPPYADERAVTLLAALGEAGVIGDRTILVYEHEKRREPPTACGPLRLRTTRCHGDTCVSIYD